MRPLGLALSFVEHTRPLQMFRHEIGRLAKGEIDVLQPSRFRGAYKKIAADINDGVEKVAAKGGVPAQGGRPRVGARPASPRSRR